MNSQLSPPKSAARRTLIALSTAVLTAGMLAAGAGAANAEPSCVDSAETLQTAIDEGAAEATLCDDGNLTVSGLTMPAGYLFTIHLAGNEITFLGAQGTDSANGTPGLTNRGFLTIEGGTVVAVGGPGSTGLGGSPAEGSADGAPGTEGHAGGPGILNSGMLTSVSDIQFISGPGVFGGPGGDGGNGAAADPDVETAPAGGTGGTGGAGGAGGDGIVNHGVVVTSTFRSHTSSDGPEGLPGNPGKKGDDYETDGIRTDGGAAGAGGQGGQGGTAGAPTIGWNDPLLYLQAGEEANAPDMLSVRVSEESSTTVSDGTTMIATILDGVWPTRDGYELTGWDMGGADTEMLDGQTVYATWNDGSEEPPAHEPPANSPHGTDAPKAGPNNISNPNAVPTLADGRIAGADRYQTANLIASQGHWSGNAVIIASGIESKQGMDALAANYLAGQVGAPILLAGPNGLSSATIAAAKNVLAGSGDTGVVYAMGAGDSVSQAALRDLLEALAPNIRPTVVRVGGTDRYATSAKTAHRGHTVGKFALTAGGTPLSTAIVASGVVNADALAAGPIAYAYNLPVLLTRATALPESVKAAITGLGIKQVIIVGGSDRVSETVEHALADLGVTSAVRVAGSSRYLTSALLNTVARLPQVANSGRQGFGMNGVTAYLANGITGFPDAITAGPLAGQQGAALLSVPAGNNLPVDVARFLNRHRGLTTIAALGRNTTVSDGLLDAATNELK